MTGSHPLTGSADLPNVTVAYDGERWSDAVASGRAIVPGEAVIPTNSGAVLAVRPVTAGDDGDPRIAIALRTIDIPEAEHPRALGPNEIRNQDIAVGEYVLRYVSGVFHLTLVDPNDSYVPGALVGWDIDGSRPTGKTGAGSWRLSGGNTDCDSIYEIQDVRPVGSGGEVILTVRSLNGQF